MLLKEKIFWQKSLKCTFEGIHFLVKLQAVGLAFSLILFVFASVKHSSHTSRNIHSIPFLSVRHSFFKNSFFPSTISEWNKLDPAIGNSENLSIFRKNVLYFIRPAPNSIYNCHNPKGVKLITWLRLGLSHLREHKFKHNLQDLINPLCNFGHNIESTTHYLLHCPLFVNERSTFFSTLSSLDCTLLDNTDSSLTQTLLFGNTSFKSNKNLKILIATIDYILSTKRFEEPIF